MPVGICLHELEAHTAARQVVERIGAVFALGIEHSHGRGQLHVGEMVVADDGVDAQFLGVFDFLHGLDAAVERNQQGAAMFLGRVDAFVRHTVTLVITIGNVVFDVRVELPEEGVDERDGRRAVHVVVAVDQDALFVDHSLVHAVHSLFHVLHQEWVMEHAQVGSEELAGLGESIDAALHEQVGQDLVDPQLLSELADGSGIALLLDDPFLFDTHKLLQYSANITILSGIQQKILTLST